MRVSRDHPALIEAGKGGSNIDIQHHWGVLLRDPTASVDELERNILRSAGHRFQLAGFLGLKLMLAQTRRQQHCLKATSGVRALFAGPMGASELKELVRSIKEQVDAPLSRALEEGAARG